MSMVVFISLYILYLYLMLLWRDEICIGASIKYVMQCMAYQTERSVLTKAMVDNSLILVLDGVLARNDEEDADGVAR